MFDLRLPLKDMFINYNGATNLSKNPLCGRYIKMLSNFNNIPKCTNLSTVKTFDLSRDLPHN